MVDGGRQRTQSGARRRVEGGERDTGTSRGLPHEGLGVESRVGGRRVPPPLMETSGARHRLIWVHKGTRVAGRSCTCEVCSGTGSSVVGQGWYSVPESRLFGRSRRRVTVPAPPHQSNLSRPDRPPTRPLTGQGSVLLHRRPTLFFVDVGGWVDGRGQRVGGRRAQGSRDEVTGSGTYRPPSSHTLETLETRDTP